MSYDEEYPPCKKKAVSRRLTRGKTRSKVKKSCPIYDTSLQPCSKHQDRIFNSKSDQAYSTCTPSTSGCQKKNSGTTSQYSFRYKEILEERQRKVADSDDKTHLKSYITIKSPLLTEFPKGKKEEKEFYKNLHNKTEAIKVFSDDKHKPNSSGNKSFEIPFSKARDNLFKELFKDLDLDKDAEIFQLLSAGKKKPRGRPKKLKCDGLTTPSKCLPPNNWDFLNEPEVDAKLKKTRNKTVKKVTTLKTEKGKAPANRIVVSETEKSMFFTAEPEVAAKLKETRKKPVKGIVISRTEQNKAETTVSKTEKFICLTPNIKKKVSRKSQKKSSVPNELILNFQLLDLNLQSPRKESTILLHPTDSHTASRSSDVLIEFNSPASRNSLPIMPLHESKSSMPATFKEECQTILSNFFISGMNKSPNVGSCIFSDKSKNAFFGITTSPSKVKTVISAVERSNDTATSTINKSQGIKVPEVECNASSGTNEQVIFIDTITQPKIIERPVLPLKEESPSAICLLEADSVLPLVSEVKFHKDALNGTASPSISKSTGIELTEFHVCKEKDSNIPLIDIATQPRKEKKDSVITAERKRKFSALSPTKAISSTLPVECSQSVSDDSDISVMPKSKNITVYSSEENYKVTSDNQIKNKLTCSTFFDNRVCKVLLQKLMIPTVLKCSKISSSPNNKVQLESISNKLAPIRLLPEEVVIGNKIPRVVLTLYGKNTHYGEIL